MAITSHDIDTQSFSVDRKGYSIEEVDIFLEKVSREVDSFHNIINRLKKSQEEQGDSIDENAKAEMKKLQSEINNYKSKISDLQTELNKKVDDGKAIADALIVAQHAADGIVNEANEKAKKIIKDADDKADFIIKDASDQKNKIMDEVNSYQKKLVVVKKEYQTMIHDIINLMKKNLTFGEDSYNSLDDDTFKQYQEFGTTEKNQVVHEDNNTPAPVIPEQVKDFSGFGDADFDGVKID